MLLEVPVDCSDPGSDADDQLLTPLGVHRFLVGAHGRSRVVLMREGKDSALTSHYDLHPPGVQALSLSLLMLIDDAVARFDAFNTDNDPYGEHDFGTVRVPRHTVFFKIDTYDAELRYHSSDPADPAVPHRVMTLMPSEEH